MVDECSAVDDAHHLSSNCCDAFSLAVGHCEDAEKPDVGRPLR